MAQASKQRTKPIGEMLALYRAAHGLNIRQHAAEIGTSSATLSRVERGYTPDLATWRLIETWLMTDPGAHDHE